VHALVIVVLLVACVAVPNVHAQSEPIDPQWQTVGEALADPCRGVVQSLIRQGRSVLGGNPAVRSTRQNAWAILLPVLRDIATDSAVATDPAVILRRIDDAVNAGRVYTASNAHEALRAVEDAANRGIERLARGETIEPGVVALIVIMDDPDLAVAWRAAASLSGFMGTRMGELMLRGIGSRAAYLIVCD
jgi:hypothetical protein